MPYIATCREWRLLRLLGTLLEGKKASYEPQTEGGDLNHELFEWELRRILTLPDSALDLSGPDFDACRLRLAKVCELLESLARPLDTKVSDPAYPRLIALTRHLETITEPYDKLFDLTSGPHQTLFRPPEQPQLKDGLELLTQCNEYMAQLTQTRWTFSHESTRKTKQKIWADTRSREHTTAVLRRLFERFNCGVHHEIMLKLPEDLEHCSVPSKLHLLLSSCPNLDRWHEALCDLCEDEPSIDSIHDICNDLQLYAEEGRTLRFLVGDRDLYGIWAKTASTRPRMEHQKSLHQLISDKCFQPPDVDALFGGSTAIHYTIQDKRALGVQLGYCLMDFFDSQLDSKRVHFVFHSGNSAQIKMPYISFSSASTSAEPHVFRVGDPLLVSFAKLLLEIDLGQNIPLEIDMSSSKGNRQSWMELYTVIEKIAEQRNDSYLEAVRGCLFLHERISKSLRGSKSDAKAAELKIRKNIYRGVVQKLENGLVEATPRVRGKRRRSESPPPASSSKEERKNIALRPISGSGMSSSKRLRSLSPVMGHGPTYPSDTKIVVSHARTLEIRENTLRGARGFFDDTNSREHSIDLCNQADNFLEDHKNTYRDVIGDVDEEEYELLSLGMGVQVPMFPHKGSRIKIAILDTGLDLGHPDLWARKGRIKDIRIWSNGCNGERNRKAGDSSGHGTHVTTLLLDIAPDCDVYIAKIAETSPQSPRDIAKAVLHCVQEWQVDIISMSFGFPNETEEGCDEITQAIKIAYSQDTLVFAAASNSGAFHGRAFPASLSNLFAIYAATGMGNRGPTTPSHEKHRDNFSTLGVAVESAWPKALSENPWKRRKSGTSFSTPIAAGIAAFVLFYARQNLAPHEALGFKQYDKMRLMLRTMSGKRDGYDIISIIELFRRPTEDIRTVMKNILTGTPFNTN